MNRVKQHDQEHVKCEVCMKEIPASEANNSEATDYVSHFCGLDCYDKWLQSAKQQSVANKQPC